MTYTTYNYNGEEFETATQGQWADDSPKKSWLHHPYKFMLSSQLAGYDGSDESGTPPPNCFVQIDDIQDTNQWTHPVQNEAAVVEYSTFGETETEELMEEPLGRMSISDTFPEQSTSPYHPQIMCIDVSSGSSTSMNALHSIGSGTPTELRDASCYSDAYWVAPAVGCTSQQVEPQAATSVVQIQSATSYYAAHQPIPPQQQSRYSSLTHHVDFMIHVESQVYPPKRLSLPATIPSSQPCLSAVKTPLTSRHRKPVGESLSLSSLPPAPASSGSVMQTSSSVPRALNSSQSHPPPPVHEPIYQPYTMLSTKAVKGRHLLPAIPAHSTTTAALSYSNSSPRSSVASQSVSPSPDVASRVPLKREATERLEDDIIRSRPVSRRGSAVSACESNSSSSSYNSKKSHSRSSSSDSFTIPPPFRRGSGSNSSSMILPKGTSAAATSSSAQNMHLVYPHPPVVFDFAMGSSKGSNSSFDLSGNEGLGGGALMNNVTRNIKEPRRPSLACTFCRERKIACGRPPPGVEDQTCNQCERRNFMCKYTNYPKKKRGQGKATRKKRGVSTGTESSTPSTPSTS